jgi:hypothetical protein
MDCGLTSAETEGFVEASEGFFSHQSWDGAENSQAPHPTVMWCFEELVTSLINLMAPGCIS